MANRTGIPNRNRGSGSELPDEEEESLQRIQEVVDSEQEFVERNLDMLKTIDFIRKGVRSDVIRTLEKDSTLADRTSIDNILNLLKRERVQTELYKALAGLDIYETNFYSAHLRGGKYFLGLKRNELNGWKIGGIEREVTKRFGNAESIEQKKLFVANRVKAELINIHARDIDDIDAIGAIVHTPSLATFRGNLDMFFDELTQNLADSSLQELELIRNAIVLPSGAPNTLNNNQPFLDLILLMDIENRETRKIGSASIFDTNRLYENYYDKSKYSDGLRSNIEVILEPNVFKDLDRSPDAKACLATLEDMRTDFINKINNDPAAEVAAATKAENDDKKAVIVARNAVRAAKIAAAAIPLAPNPITLAADAAAAKTAAEAAAAAPANAGLAVRAATLAATFTRDIAAAESAEEAIVTAKDAIADAEAVAKTAKDVATVSKNVAKAVNDAAVAPNPANVNKAAEELLKQLLKRSVPNNIDIDLNPFELMERIFYIQYCNENHIDLADMNEKAKSYAQLKARLRSKEAENSDIHRISNQEEIKHFGKGRSKRAWDRTAALIAKIESKIGLEPVEIGKQSSHDILKQIINQKPEFAAFKGINKYSSIRDIRQILYNGESPTSPIVIKEFISILKATIIGFQSNKNGTKFKVISGDWDLVGLIGTLQKLEVETETRKMLETANREGHVTEQDYLKFLKQFRIKEQEVENELISDLESPDAFWKILFSKKLIKKLVNQRSGEKLEKINNEQIKQLELMIDDLHKKAQNHLDGSARQSFFENKANAIQTRLDTLQEKAENSKNLKTRVEDAVRFVEDNNLSKAEARDYYETLELTQVIDKIGTNLKMDKYMRKSKAGIAALWRGTKGFAKWCKNRFVKNEDANTKDKGSIGKYTSYPGGLIARPIYIAGSIGGKIFGLVGDAIGAVANIPGGAYRGLSKNAMQNYLLTKPLDLGREAERLTAKINDLTDKLAVIKSKNYSVNYQKILQSRINNIIIKKQEIAVEYARLEYMSKQFGLTISNLSVE